MMIFSDHFFIAEIQPVEITGPSVSSYFAHTEPYTPSPARCFFFGPSNYC